MPATVSDFDVVLLLGVVTAVGLFFALVVGTQGSDGRDWWRDRFGVGWPTLVLLYCLVVAGLWLPLALGTTVPDRHDLGYFLGGLLFVGGTLPVARALGSLGTVAALARTPVADAGTAPHGRVAVEGTVETVGDDATHAAPLSGERAVVSRLKVDTVPADESERTQRRNRRTAANVERAHRFAVRDATGAVHVDPDGVRLRIASEGTRRIEPDEPVPESLAAFLDRERVDRAGSVLLCDVATLAPGDDAFVLGTAERTDRGVAVRDGLVVPGDRRNAVRRFSGTVLWAGGAGLAVALAGVATMALRTGAL